MRVLRVYDAKIEGSKSFKVMDVSTIGNPVRDFRLVNNGNNCGSVSHRF